MKDTKVERTRQKAMMFERQFLQGNGDVFDQAFDRAFMATVSAQAPGHRERTRLIGDRPRLIAA